MTFFEPLTIFYAFFIFISSTTFTYLYRKQRGIIPTNWPVLGMIPAFLVNSHRVYDYITEGLIHTGGTFMWKGPWFTGLNILITTDPSNIQHVLCKNFKNYPKGDDFRKIFDILGDGIFNSDGELWEIHRKITISLLKNTRYQSFLEVIIWENVENGLLPVLESVQETEVDLQDIFNRLTFDITCKVILDYEPRSLSVNYPNIPCLKAFSDAEEAVLYRHITPPTIWKFQKFLGFGSEKKMSNAKKILDDFIYTHLTLKQNENNTMNYEHHQEKKFLLFPLLVREIIQINDRFEKFGNPTKILRDTLLSLMIAGKDSISSVLSWFFYILAKNPNVEDKIMEELHTVLLNEKTGEKWDTKRLTEMVYLHGAILEVLRLFPPVPVNHKSPLQTDVLPSGHRVEKNTKILLCYYSMGRMKSIWGDDCLEFKPERWICEGRGIRHEPSYKFTAFNAGPRTCVGKDMSLFQLKIVLATIIYRYHVELVEGHSVVPSDSMILQMKHGLKVRLMKRSNV